MKFKKVGIQAFRAYDKLEDGTFNFSDKDDLPVNFISIYAPNGFGKTSFYDAVEYGITNSISRLIKKHAINKSIARNERSINIARKGNLILRNRNSDQNLDAFVTIQTDDKRTFNRAIPEPKTINSSDFHFNTKEVENDYFQTVVLSQEWIDAFLREDNPEDRYKKFIEYFGDSEIDEYHNKISDLLNQNEKNIKSLKNDLKGVQKELDFDGDKGILKTINAKIEELNKKGEKLIRVSKSYSESDSVEMSNAISERIIKIESEIKSFELITQAIEDALIGGNNNVGLEQYYKTKTSLKNLIEEEKKLKNLLITFKLIDEKRNEIKGIKDSIFYQNKLSKTIEKHIEALPKYKSLLERIKDKEVVSEKAIKELSDKEELFSKIKEQNSKQTIQLNGLSERISILEKKQIELSQIKDTLDKVIKDLSNLKSPGDLQKQIGDKEKSLKTLEEDEITLRILLNNIKQNHFPRLIDSQLLQYEKEVLNIKTKQEEIEKKKNKINEVNIQIKEQKNFENEIESFISKGAELVNSKKLDVCPLCTKDYNDYSLLSDKISKNKFLSNINSTLLNRLSILQEELDKISNETKNYKDKLIEKLENRTTEFDIQTLKLSREISRLRDEYLELDKRKSELTRLKEDNVKKLNNKDFSDYQNELNEELKNLKIELKKSSEKEKFSSEKIKEYINEIKVLNNKLSLAKEEKKSLEQKELITSLSDFLSTPVPTSEKAEELLKNKLEEVNTKSNTLSKKEKSLNIEIEDLDKKLRTSNKKQLEDNLIDIESKKISYNKTIRAFEVFLASNLELLCESIPKNSLKEELDKKKRINKQNIKKSTSLILDFNLITKLKSNVEPYLKYEEAVVKEKSIKEQIIFLQETIKNNLKDEKEKVANYIHKLVESFFYENLINEIYKRIDPHPDYTSIKFICDFKGGKPKLNVCAYKKGQKEYIIPNLYFSTAQLNIMSLSIFLAKALNAKDPSGKDLECILIDDPIQSMDSINILSTIDLIRSLVVNYNKQIIISTHDENFHNLLKKKIPESLYKSKYFELETFGKVKRS